LPIAPAKICLADRKLLLPCRSALLVELVISLDDFQQFAGIQGSAFGWEKPPEAFLRQMLRRADQIHARMFNPDNPRVLRSKNHSSQNFAYSKSGGNLSKTGSQPVSDGIDLLVGRSASPIPDRLFVPLTAYPLSGSPDISDTANFTAIGFHFNDHHAVGREQNEVCFTGEVAVAGYHMPV